MHYVIQICSYRSGSLDYYQSIVDRPGKAHQMSFARHNRGRPLFSRNEIVSARERTLLSENRRLHERNKRLKDAMMTLVERVETQLPYLQEQSETFERANSSTNKQTRNRDKAYGERSRKYRYTPPPKMEVYETFEEPIEFADPAPEMRFVKKNGEKYTHPPHSPANEDVSDSSDFAISPELAPEEIDILKSPTMDRSYRNTFPQETVDVVDLHPTKHKECNAAEHYEESTSSQSEIVDFEFPEEEPVIDIDFERKESLRAAMRRRVNRLRW